jgi:hypothetical protein
VSTLALPPLPTQSGKDSADPRMREPRHLTWFFV